MAYYLKLIENLKGAWNLLKVKGHEFFMVKRHEIEKEVALKFLVVKRHEIGDGRGMKYKENKMRRGFQEGHMAL